MGSFGATWGGPREASNDYFQDVNTLQIVRVLELGRFSVTCGGVWIFFVFSLLFREWFLLNGEVNSLSNTFKMKVLHVGPYVNFKKLMAEKLVFGGELWAPNITKMI